MNNQKRIAYLTFDFLEPIFSGNGTLSRIQIFGLLEKGYKVLVICPSSEEKDPQTSIWIKKGSLTLIQIPIISTKDLSPSCDWRDFHRQGLSKIDDVKKFGPHLVVNPDWHTIDLAIILKTTLNIPLISQFYRIFSYFKKYIPNEEEYNIVKQKEIQLVSRSDLVITLSRFDQGWSQKHGAVHTRVVYPPLSEEFIHSITASKNEIFSDEIRLITVSRLVPEKNILRIFPILKELESMGITFSYTLIGEPLDAQYEKKIRKTIETMKFRSRIQLLGRMTMDEMMGHLRNHPIYIHTSSYEPFGITITEAAAAGCAIVLDQDGLIGAKDLLQKYSTLTNTLLIDYLDPKTSAMKIQNLIETIQLKNQNSINSKLISKLSPTEYIENLVNIFRDFL